MKSNRVLTLLKYVVPSVIGQICFFLFTIVDGIFVGQGVGTNALGAVNLVFPLLLVLDALFMLIIVGGVAVTAVRMGKDNKEGANDAFMHSAFLMLILSVVMCIVGTTLARPLGYMLGANETYIDYVYDYLLWYSVFLVPNGMGVLLQYFCRNDGSPVLVMIASAISSGLNIFLDWLFVFPLKMGIAGAAIATGISQTVSFLILTLHFIFKKGNLRVKKFKFQAVVFKKIFLRGIPETVSRFATPVATYCYNYVLLNKIGELALNSFSVICYVASFSVAVFAGVSQGIQPLLGQAYGEKDDKEVHFIRNVSAIIDLVGVGIVYGLLFVVGKYICMLFGADADTTNYTVSVMPIYALGFIGTALNSLISTYLYSTKRTKEAIVLNSLRSFVFNIFAVMVLPLIFGAEFVWWTFLIYEMLSFVVGFILMQISERKGVVYK